MVNLQAFSKTIKLAKNNEKRHFSLRITCFNHEIDSMKG